jgi:DNA (cytosine-5)-methyltransferase 1
MTDKTNFNAISLFSGLGGDSLGMTQAGCKLIAYNELKPAFCKSHEANFPDSELIHDGSTHDISKLKDSLFEKYKDTTDILFAGFPCQGFSSAGKKKDDDPRNTMFLEFLRAANGGLKRELAISNDIRHKQHLKIVELGIPSGEYNV